MKYILVRKYRLLFLSKQRALFTIHFMKGVVIMKFAMKCLTKVWLTIGGVMVVADAVGFMTCKMLEKVGKPLKSLSTVYNNILNYKSVKIVAIKWLVTFFMWPVGVACAISGFDFK